MTRSIHIIALVLILTSCASAPNLETYTIDMTSSERARGDADLDVVVFVVSEKLASSRIVILESPTRLDSYATARWASSIGGMVQEKLAVEFGEGVGDQPKMVVSGVVRAFEQVDQPGGPAGRVRLDVEIRQAGSNRSEAPILAKSYSATREAEGNNADAVVRALSRALEDIAAEIAADAAGI